MKYRIFWIGYILVVCILFAVRVYIVNNEYPAPQKESYSVKESFEQQGIRYMVEDIKVWKADDDWDKRVLCVELNIENISPKIQDVDLTSCILNYNYSSKYPRRGYLNEFNDENASLRMRIFPGVKTRITIPYLIFKRNMEADSRVLNGKRDFCELVFGLYPCRKAVELKTDELLN